MLKSNIVYFFLRYFLLSCAFLSLAPITLTRAEAETEAKTEAKTTLKIRQNSPALGTVVVFVTPHAFRLEKGDLISVARAPEWTVHFFSLKKKLMVKCKFDQAVKVARMAEATTMAAIETNSPWKKAGSGKIAGLSAQCWTGQPAGGKSSSFDVRNLTYWVYSDKSLPPQCAKFVAVTYGLPPMDGFPLQMTYLGKSSALYPAHMRTSTSEEKVRVRSWLETSQSARVAVEDSIFSVPKGFKEAANYTDLYLEGPLSRDNVIIKDLLRDPKALFQSQ